MQGHTQCAAPVNRQSAQLECKDVLQCQAHAPPMLMVLISFKTRATARHNQEIRAGPKIGGALIGGALNALSCSYLLHDPANASLPINEHESSWEVDACMQSGSTL